MVGLLVFVGFALLFVWLFYFLSLSWFCMLGFVTFLCFCKLVDGSRFNPISAFINFPCLD